MPPRFGNVGHRSSSSSSRRSSSSSSGRSPGTGRQQQQRSQRTSSRGAQRGVSGKTTKVKAKAKKAYSPSNVPSWRSAGSKKVTPGISGLPKRTVQTQKEKDEAEELRHYNKWAGQTAHQGAGAGNVTNQNIIDARKKAAYDASKDRQADMRRAIDMAYGTGNVRPEDQKAYDEETLRLLNLKGTKDAVSDVNIGRKSIIDQAKSTFHTLTDNQKQFLIDSGFAAAESSGVLGGTFGAELEVNKLKKILSDPYSSNEDYNAALAAMDKLNRDIGGSKATDMQQAMGFMQHDPSAVYSWDDVESDNYLKNAFYDMQSSDLKPGQYTDYMDKIKAFGHMGTAPKGSGSDGGGWGGGYGYGGGGDGGVGGF